MTNQDQAAEVIRTWQKRHPTVMDNNPDWAAQNLAGDLKQAGLISPDLPEPDRITDRYLVWEDEEVWIVDGEAAVYTDLGEFINWMSVRRARNLAYILLAAVKFQEEQ